MVLVDTHTHLYLDAFQNDILQVLQRAKKHGVSSFLLPAINATHIGAMKGLKQRFSQDIYLMAGLHPSYVGADYKTELEVVSKELKTPDNSYVAVGEIGIDKHWSTTFLDEQKAAFRIQIQWAKQYGLPIVIHCRDAFDEVFDILELQKEGLWGVLHCFTGNLEQAKRAISCHMALGIGGVVTFKNGKINRFIRQIPIEHIVLETDAPYLAPSPHRGKRNESAYLMYVVRMLADIYGVSESYIAQITTDNAKKIFGQINL